MKICAAIECFAVANREQASREEAKLGRRLQRTRALQHHQLHRQRLHPQELLLVPSHGQVELNLVWANQDRQIRREVVWSDPLCLKERNGAAVSRR